MSKYYLITLLALLLTIQSNAQCAAGEVEVIINTTGGGFSSEKWVDISTGTNSTGSIVWNQDTQSSIPGTIGNGSGLLTNESVCLTSGTTYFFNTYDSFDDSWDGTTYTIEVCGTIIANNGGVTPNDGIDNDANGSWEGTLNELETSESFTPMMTKSDYCENDPVGDLCAPQSYSSNSGMAGVAVILVTDDFASEISFDVYDFDGTLMFNENTFPSAPGTLQNNTVYTLYDNPCYNITTTAGIPETIDIFDSASDGIFDNTASLVGAGLYIYYYAADAIESITDNGANNSVDYLTPGTLGFPAFYTVSTNTRTTPPSHNNGSSSIVLPPSSSHEYVSSGSWSGPGVTNGGTVSKTYFSGLAGLERTINVNSGSGQFTPSPLIVGANQVATYNYNSTVGSAGVAPCNTVSTTTTEIDVHAIPSISATNGPCTGATYDVVLDIDLDTYNVSVDEDGATPFTLTGTGGTLSSSTLAGTGVHQITISNITIGDSWSINVNDITGLSCGLSGTNGDCISLLPIELVEFNAIKNNRNKVDLNWVTNSEINNDYFTLESSKDGLIWSEINTIQGAGNSSSTLHYTDFDGNPNQPISYYRLKQTDFDGTTSYSEIKYVLFSELKDNFSIYPNPALNDLWVKTADQNINNLSVYNLLGQDISNRIEFKKVNDGYKLSLINLQPGVYFIKNTQISTRFIKK